MNDYGRWTINLSRRVKPDLDWLLEHTEAEYRTQVVHNALKLHRALLEMEREGFRLYAESPEYEMRRIKPG